jgi:hypothetical protein
VAWQVGEFRSGSWGGFKRWLKILATLGIMSLVLKAMGHFQAARSPDSVRHLAVRTLLAWLSCPAGPRIESAAASVDTVGSWRD